MPPAGSRGARREEGENNPAQAERLVGLSGQARKRVSAPRVAVTANTIAAAGQKLRATVAQNSAAPVRQNKAMISAKTTNDAAFKAVMESPLPRYHISESTSNPVHVKVHKR